MDILLGVLLAIVDTMTFIAGSEGGVPFLFGLGLVLFGALLGVVSRIRRR